MAVRKDGQDISTDKGKKSRDLLSHQLKTNYFSEERVIKQFNPSIFHQFSIKRGKTVAGIYEIVHVSGFRYAGSSMQIIKRLEDHASSLKRGNHDNIKLQSLFNACPQYYYRVHMVEILNCDSKGNVLWDQYSLLLRQELERECKELEQDLLDQYRAVGIELNIAKDVTNSFADQLKIIIVNGVEYPSVSQAATELNINRKKLSRMANDPEDQTVFWK